MIAILLFTASTAWPRIAGERPVSYPLYGLAPGGKQPPSVATDGDGFLVAWNDARSLPETMYVARLSANGELTYVDRNGVVSSRDAFRLAFSACAGCAPNSRAQ